MTAGEQLFELHGWCGCVVAKEELKAAVRLFHPLGDESGLAVVDCRGLGVAPIW